MELSISKEKGLGKVVMVLSTLVATSLFLFPFELDVLPGVNTKMMMAVIGGAILIWRLLLGQVKTVSHDFLWMLILSGAFSSISLLSVSYNYTSDYAYATYIVSMLVWLSAAYAVTEMIHVVHQTCSFRLLVSYLLSVCTLQCFLALWIDEVPAFKAFVDAYIDQGEAFLNNVERLYGIGASLDVAGSRFATVLVLTSALLCTDSQIVIRKFNLVVTLIAFLIVLAVGTMIARTTLIGALVSIAYLIYSIPAFNTGNRTKRNYWILLRWIIPISILMTLLGIYLYRTNSTFHDLFRFAFEGFFNWYEQGVWETSSTNVLSSMWVWPDDLKTWLIGDGYFSNPYGDPNYVGDTPTSGYYMRTDVGYLRFIYYCGVFGLVCFIIFLLFLCLVNYRKYKKEKPLFLMLFVLQLMIFGKVSTDIFLILALFFCANVHEDTAEGKLTDSLA
jgi:hypothetical protein